MSASTTATEEDTEQLRDLVAATLEKEGILGKIKAQLRSYRQLQHIISSTADLFELKMFKIFNLIFPRAHVYLSLEGESSKSKALAQESKNHKLVAFLSNTNGRLVASLVRYMTLVQKFSQHESFVGSSFNFSTWTSVWQFLTQRQTLVAMCNTEREQNSALP